VPARALPFPIGKPIDQAEAHAATASISRTHSQCQRGASQLPNRGRQNDRETRIFIPGKLVVVEPIGIEPMT
jgi:hypothetical protein